LFVPVDVPCGVEHFVTPFADNLQLVGVVVTDGDMELGISCCGKVPTTLQGAGVPFA